MDIENILSSVIRLSGFVTVRLVYFLAVAAILATVTARRVMW